MLSLFFMKIEIWKIPNLRHHFLSISKTTICDILNNKEIVIINWCQKKNAFYKNDVFKVLCMVGV